MEGRGRRSNIRDVRKGLGTLPAWFRPILETTSSDRAGRSGGCATIGYAVLRRKCTSSFPCNAARRAGVALYLFRQADSPRAFACLVVEGVGETNWFAEEVANEAAI